MSARAVALRTLEFVAGMADSASKPYRGLLLPHVLVQLELAAVAQWLFNQDEGANPERVVEIARQSVANIHAKYERTSAKGG